MTKQRCRWSGWPGAFCLDCGREDPREVALADGTLQFACRRQYSPCRCPTADEWLSCIHFGPTIEIDEGYCTQPGSDRHNLHMSRGAKRAIIVYLIGLILMLGYFLWA